MANTHSTDLEASSSQYWSVADNASLSITGDITISAWIKPESITGEDAIVSKFDSTGNQRSYLLSYQSTVLTFGVWSNGTTGSQKSVSQSFSAGTWYHVAVAYDASAGSADFYVDGSKVGTTQTGMETSIFDGTAKFQIGALNETATSFYDGLIDEVLVYNAVLSAGTIGSLYSDPCNPSTTNLVSRWAFDNDGTDSQGSNNLTNNNSATFSVDTAFSCASAEDAAIFFGCAF